MEKIGKLLRERRLELGLTVEDISDKTRLTIKHIHALEEGDISFFKDDLTYLRFFLRSYCNALDIDFDEIKDELRESINEYTTTFSMSAQQEHNDMEESISSKSKKLSGPKKTQNYTLPPRHKARRKVDISLISFLIIVAVVVAGLLYTAFVRVQEKNADENVNNIPPVVEEDNSTPKEEVKPPVEEKKEVKIEKEDINSYTISNLEKEEEVIIEVKFGSSSWFAGAVNDVQTADPVSKVYNPDEVIQLKVPFDEKNSVQLTFGFMKGNTISVNGKEIEIDESLKNAASRTVFNFKMKGEE